MLKIKNSFRYSVLIIVVLSFVTSCKTTQSPVSENNTVIIASMDLVDIITDKVKVEIIVTDMMSDTINYYLPKIVPGTYSSNNYGKYIDDLKAFDSQGNPLPVQQKGDNQWKINNTKELSKITYWVNDTFDNESTHQIFSPTGSNILKDENFVLNLYAFIGYFDGMKENKYRILLKHPKKLEASTSLEEDMPKETLENVTYDVDLFSFKKYADVVDSPIMYSVPNKVSFTTNGIEVSLSVYSPNNIHKASQLMADMEHMIRAQKNFIGDINTTKKYSILLYLSSNQNDDATGYGALEHNTSTVVVLPESLSYNKLSKSLIDIVSHEFFHIVTPIAIHSKEIHYFDYNTPKMSKHLWLYEGTTEYFSLLFQISQGLIPKEEFFKRILEKIEHSKAFDDTMSFTEMSENILQEPYKHNYRNVYEKGALISMCIDILIREKSEGKLGLLYLIQNLAHQFGSKTPFDDKELIKIVEEITYPEVGDFLKTHVEGNTPIDYAFFLQKVGLEYHTKDIPSSYFIHDQEPNITASEDTNEIVFSSEINHNNFFQNLGIKGGDILHTINDKKYNRKNIYHLFSDSNAWNIGDEITFEIKRNSKLIKLTTKAVLPTVKKIIINQNPNASSTQLSLLKSWVNE